MSEMVAQIEREDANFRENIVNSIAQVDLLSLCVCFNFMSVQSCPTVGHTPPTNFPISHPVRGQSGEGGLEYSILLFRW